jgi:predicted TIM-barrel fold metal-dependent hydrolase
MKITEGKPRIIDCDIHCRPNEKNPIESFTSKRIATALEQNMEVSPQPGYRNPFGVDRRDVEFSTPQDIETHYLNPHQITYEVLQPQPCMYYSLNHSIDVGNALCEAANNWLVHTYLERDPRYLGSLCVNTNDPIAAATEIRRIGGHRQMVQVIVPGEAAFLYGHRHYHPIYDACQEMGLVFAIHPGYEGTYGSSTPVGRPSSYFEWHTSLSLTFMAHASSLLLEGTFEKFPKLRILLTEGGVGWLPPLLWRMDKNFKALRSTTPWLKRPPSAYAFEHFRLTTQPVEEPQETSHFLSMLEMVQADKTLCYSSDFPHWDFDDPVRAFPTKTPEAIMERILWGNAADLYRNKLSQLAQNH